MKIVRATDIHYNFVHAEKKKAFIRHINEANAELVLLGGDISDGDPSTLLNEISSNIWHDIYYVLGNHDFYGESINVLRHKVVDTQKIRYLPNHGVIHIDDNTSILGHDCWGDGRNGDPISAFLDPRNPHSVQLRDFTEIRDLKIVHKIQNLFVQKLNELGDQAANHFRKHLPATHDNVIILTHVPPFQDVCYYHENGNENRPLIRQNDDWAPFFTCKAVGDLLMTYANENPHKKILVMSGHMHVPMDKMITKNMRCTVGKGSYKEPQLDVFDTEELFSTWHV